MTAPFDRRLFTILAVVFVNMVGAAMILPILPLYALETFRLPESQITLIVSSFFVAQLFAGPVLGRLSDQYGRLPVLIVSQAGTVLSFIMIGLANSAWLLLVARIIDGITGGNIIVAQAYMTDVTPREKRTQTLGYIFAIFGLGFVIGPALGGELSARFGPRIPFFIAAGLAALTLAMTVLFLDESLTPEKKQANRAFRKTGLSIRQLLQNKTLVRIFLIVFFGQFGLGVVQSTFALWGNAVLYADYPEAEVLRNIGLLLATVGLTQFVTQSVLLPRLLRKITEPVLVLSGNVVRVTASILFAIARTPPVAFLGSVLFPLGLGVMNPSLQSMATEAVDDELRGGVLGVYQSVVSLAIIVGTGIGGTLFMIAPAVPYWSAAAVGLLALAPAFSLFREPPAPGLHSAHARAE